MIDELHQHSVVSVLKLFLEWVVKQWKKTHPTVVDEFLDAQKHARTLRHIRPYARPTERFWIEPANGEIGEGLRVDDRVFILPDTEQPRRACSVYTLAGQRIGNYQWKQDTLPSSWLHPEKIDARVSEIQRTEGEGYQIEVSVEVI